MKYLFLILTLVSSLALPVFADGSTPDTIQVDVTKLNETQLRYYQEFKSMQERAKASTTLENLTPEKVDKYAQMGKGLGIAINEGLGAVTKNVEQFAQTSAGKWIMVLVTWKVMGQDAIDLTRTAMQYTIGLFLVVVGIPFWIWIIRRNCVLCPIDTVEKTGFWSKKIVYKNQNPIHEDSMWVYGLMFAAYLAITAAITFLH